MGKFLKLPSGQLSKLAELQRKEELKKKLADPPTPLFKEVRELILRKCRPEKEKQVRAIFEKQPFGELERLVTQKLLDVVKRAAKEELESQNWLHLVARLSGRSYEQMRVTILEFMDTDVFNVSVENCVSFLDPLIESWDIDLATFGMEIVLTRISDLNSISESSDRGFHQYSCGCERDRDIPEVDTQWVKPQTGPFSSPSTPLSRSISKVCASLPTPA